MIWSRINETDSEVLRAEAVTKTFGDIVAIDRLDLSIERGGILALLGHNGAGKSTFAQLAAGVLRPTEGRLTLATDPSGQPIKVGYVSQDIAIYPRSTVRANLNFVARLAGTGPAEVDRSASALGLDELMDRRGHQLSGGQKRRLHAALGLVVEPTLLLLDEPTAGADAVTRDRILQAVREVADAGVAVVYTTHYAPEVEQLDPRVVVLRRGSVVVDATVEEIVALGGDHGVEVTIEGAIPGNLPDGWSNLDGQRVFVPLNGSDPAESIFAHFRSLGAAITEFRRVKPSLDRALVRLSADSEVE